MKVVIVGAGSVGFQLARQLISENKDVVLIEKNPDRAHKATNSLDCMVITGEGTNLEVLKQAGLDSEDYFVAVTDSDEVNMIACGLVSSEFSVEAKIARVRNLDYHSSRLSGKQFLGIDYVVNPETEAARAIIRSIEHGAVSDIMLFEQANVQMRNIMVERDSAIADIALKNLNNVLPGSFLVAVIVRDNQYLIPSGDTVVRVGDILYTVATQADFEEIFSRIGKAKFELKKIVVIGGGKIGQQLVEYLLAEEKTTLIRRLVRRFTKLDRKSIKIIDRDYERCKLLAERFQGALVINADISEDGVFEDQHFANSDLVIAVTDNQELNIVAGLYAKSLGIKRSVILVNRSGYTSIAHQLGIDVSVSQKNSLVTSILKYIRSGNIKSVHAISDGHIEAIELTVSPESRAVGKMIQDLSLPKDTLIVSLQREGMNLVPQGSQIIRSDDHLVVVAAKKDADRIQGIFTE